MQMIQHILTLEKGLLIYTRVMMGNEDQEVAVTRTAHTPLYHILLDHSFTTCSMQLITWGKVYSIFPAATFIRREGFTTQLMGNNPDQRPHTNKWRILGFTVLPIHLHDAMANVYDQAADTGNKRSMTLNGRRIGDQHSWIVPLDASDIQAESHPSYLRHILDLWRKQVFHTLRLIRPSHIPAVTQI
jgi:hypothetical protein